MRTYSQEEVGKGSPRRKDRKYPEGEKNCHYVGSEGRLVWPGGWQGRGNKSLEGRLGPSQVSP